MDWIWTGGVVGKILELVQTEMGFLFCVSGGVGVFEEIFP